MYDIISRTIKHTIAQLKTIETIFDRYFLFADCARDTKIYQLAGLLFSLSCRSNGNYASLQMDGTLYYCVDSDGFATTESSDDDLVRTTKILRRKSFGLTKLKLPKMACLINITVIFGHPKILSCSRRRSDMERSGNHVFVSLHCDTNGNYAPLQCDVESQQCWCAESRTGVPTSPVVPLGLMSKLPCYDRRTVGSQYLRRCESELYAQRRIADEFRAHGTRKVNFPLHFCQYDGSFGPLRVQRGIVFCVWRDGSHLGYQQPADSSIVNVTCNCAIDERIFAEAGLNHMMSCLANGNYNPVQFSGTHYFCVDQNGFVIRELTENPPDCS
ncbi:secreted modular calcium-binding protein [Holotrichia oblita]|uniref:Secreted modular calcium-binding protein n=1 Tax=Holotrichia oblita TaxID=644536 RepID=A0ACB9SJ45_HOLOL|nr:secreted modular calcium-binding protein [Holotrichia oblita]